MVFFKASVGNIAACAISNIYSKSFKITKKWIKNTNGNTGETRWGRWRTSWSCRVVNWANWYIAKRPRNQRKHTGDQMKKSYVASPVQLVPSSFDLVSRVSPLAPYPFYNVITSPVILVANSK